jgi:hypothetical protein
VVIQGPSHFQFNNRVVSTCDRSTCFLPVTQQHQAPSLCGELGKVESQRGRGCRRIGCFKGDGPIRLPGVETRNASKNTVRTQARSQITSLTIRPNAFSMECAAGLPGRIPWRWPTNPSSCAKAGVCTLCDGGKSPQLHNVFRGSSIGARKALSWQSHLSHNTSP